MKTVRLRVPSPADPGRLDTFVVANLHGLSRKRVKGLVNAGSVRVDGRVERRAGRPVRPGEVVEVAWRPSWGGVADLPKDALLAEGEGWCAVHKPAGLPSHRPDEDGIGVPERFAARFGRRLTPAHRLDRETSGLLVLAEGDALARWSEAFAERNVAKTYLAVVHPPPDRDGPLIDEVADMFAEMHVLRRSTDGTRAEVAVHPREGRTHQVRRLLAAAGSPVVGDLEYGTPVPGGAPRMALHCRVMNWGDVTLSVEPPDEWEQLLEPAARTTSTTKPPPPRKPRPRRSSRRRTLRISRTTSRILKGGHPWVVRDRDTGSTRDLPPGALVELVDPAGTWVATAVADPSAKVCARVVSMKPGADLSAAGWEARAHRALDKRRDLLTADTDVARLVHGQADGFPGLFVDKWGPVLVATRTTVAVDAYTDVVYDAVRARFDLPLYEKDHMADLRARRDGASGDDLRGRWVHGDHGPEVVIQEHGLRFDTTPFEGLTTGFYPDQRSNRSLLTALENLEGARVANLFGHTGAFSVALAAAGAGVVTTVDLSHRYLAVAEANLRANGLDPNTHTVVAADAVRWIEAQDGTLDGIVLDPPAFAQTRGRGRGFSAKGDYRSLVAACARSLGPGGWMLCCRNLRAQRRGSLRADVEAGIRDAGRRIAETRRAGPAPDHPLLKGFPEGTSFAGLFLRLQATRVPNHRE